MEENKSICYKDTLNLPQTKLPMRANATIKEVETQKFWDENKIYGGAPMSENVRLGDGVVDEAKSEANNRLKELARITVNMIFDDLERRVKGFPDAIKRLRNNPEVEQKVEALWSEQLFEEGLAPKGYSGLPDKLLVANLHQDGYLDGMYVGYILAMMALVDNDAPKDMILAVRDYIRPNLTGHHFDDREEFISQYKSEKYSWVEKEKADPKEAQ